MDNEFWSTVTRLLEEMVQDKRAERAQREGSAEQRPVSPLNRLFNWLVKNWVIISAMVGAIWTVNTFFVQQQQRLEQQQREDLLRRQSMIVEFAVGLSDKEKRNTSAYALAVLSGEEAVPLLLAQLIEAAQSDQDASFRDALIQSLITIGEPVVDPVFDLNRQAAFDSVVENTTLISATQPIVVHFLTTDIEVLNKDQSNFSGIGLQNVRLAYRDFDGLNLSELRIRNSNLCRAKLTNANLEDAVFLQVQLGCVDFEGSILSGGNFSDSDFTYANLKQVIAIASNFKNARLDDAQMAGATLINSDFSDGYLSGTTFDNAQLVDANFSKADASQASFVGAELENVNFTYADLGGANFSNANLAKATFFKTPDDTPHLPPGFRTIGDVTLPRDSGAFVENANFEGAQNVDEITRKYLCKWGAINVPGGCEDISEEDSLYEYEHTGVGVSHSRRGRGSECGCS